MDRYELREELGDGTFGTVFRAVHKTRRDEVRSLCSVASADEVKCHKSFSVELMIERTPRESLNILACTFL